MCEGNRNSVVSVVARLRLGQSEVRAPARETISPSPLDSFGVHKASIKLVPEALPTEIKQHGPYAV